MFGLVKKSLLMDAQANVTELEKQLSEAKEELSSIQKILASPEYMKATNLMKLEEELLVLRATCHDVRVQCEKDREAAKEHLADIEKQCALVLQENENSIGLAKSELAEEIENAHRQKDLILTEAKSEREKVLSNAEAEAHAIVDKATTRADKVLADVEKKIETGETREKVLSNSIEKLREELRDLELTKENQDVLATVTPFEHFLDGPTSDEIKVSLQQVKNEQKNIIVNSQAYIIKQDFYSNAALTVKQEIKRRSGIQNRQGKFLVATFNAEVDHIISLTTARNFVSNTRRIEKCFNKVNKHGEDLYVVLDRTLLFLRLKEQRHAFEYKYKKEMELEEQRFMKESLREEAKVKKEIESFVIAREKEEKTFQKDLSDALARVQTANQEEVEKLNSHIEELKLKLERATSEKERALSMAQLTRSGYVYVISNKGSFGENVYKIGMTRRLEPMDRVKELGDASVPFFFDVHALIASDDAPALENKLHSKFASRRVNKVNHRREFFNLTFEEVEEALNELVEGDFNLVRDVVAMQYEESKFLEEREAVNG
ncbi:DUF4041 domain-containing protein [Vibrio cyclitrophicus]|uniref:DUF4041 domain-containing protein n=1 Tax=Vibrio cyclitrophicus TaxID=47951 RepID=UPI000C81780A|nr:DUF4041 domain-containing protein [Vibrio cyclitrophicus]PME22020.1 hypothetical protein BCV43_06640 [Vibrio cyclitrophicus]